MTCKLQTDGRGNFRLARDDGAVFLLNGPVDWELLWNLHPEAVMRACGAAQSEERRTEELNAIADIAKRRENHE